MCGLRSDLPASDSSFLRIREMQGTPSRNSTEPKFAEIGLKLKWLRADKVGQGQGQGRDHGALNGQDHGPPNMTNGQTEGLEIDHGTALDADQEKIRKESYLGAQ